MRIWYQTSVGVCSGEGKWGINALLAKRTKREKNKLAALLFHRRVGVARPENQKDREDAELKMDATRHLQ